MYILYRYIYIYAVEYYSAMRKKEILPFVAQHIDFEGTMVISLIGKDKYCMVSLICGILKKKKKKSQIHTKSRKNGQERGGGVRERLVKKKGGGTNFHL